MTPEERELAKAFDELGSAIYEAVCGSPLVFGLPLEIIYLGMGGIIIFLLCWNLIRTRQNYQALRNFKQDWMKEIAHV